MTSLAVTAATDPVPASRLRRGASGTALRGHLVPDSVHAVARRRKVELRSDRGVRVTWDDVMRDGIILMPHDPDTIHALLIERADQVAGGHGPRRLVQATLPLAVERRLLDTYLALNEGNPAATTYEQLWTLAIVMWLDQNT